MCTLFFHYQGSDLPQKHAGAGSPSPAVEISSSHQTTPDSDTEQHAEFTVGTIYKHTDKHTCAHKYCLRDERRFALYLSSWLTFHRLTRMSAECFIVPMA